MFCHFQVKCSIVLGAWTYLLTELAETVRRERVYYPENTCILDVLKMLDRKATNLIYNTTLRSSTFLLQKDSRVRHRV